MDLTALVEKLEYVAFDKGSSGEEYTYIDFVIDGLPYYTRMTKWNGFWEVDGVFHFWEGGSECSVCRKTISCVGKCKEIDSEQEFVEYLLKTPNVRLIALLNGVKL